MDEWVEIGTLSVPWAPKQPPATIVAMPAASVPELAGRRVVVGVPDRGWHTDLRIIDGPRVEEGRTVVEICPEWEYYRRRVTASLMAVETPPAVRHRLLPPPMPAYPVPIDWVWVETPLSRPGPAKAEPARAGPPETVLDRVTPLTVPAVRIPVPRPGHAAADRPSTGDRHTRRRMA
jgi:hypothetical protein